MQQMLLNELGFHFGPDRKGKLLLPLMLLLLMLLLRILFMLPLLQGSPF